MPEPDVPSPTSPVRGPAIIRASWIGTGVFAVTAILAAIAPSSGPTTWMPRAVSSAMLAVVAACCHMRTFIAGATSTGLSVASSNVDARSSASPAAIFASMSAEAGATTTRSALRDSWMWPISLSSVSEKRST